MTSKNILLLVLVFAGINCTAQPGLEWPTPDKPVANRRCPPFEFNNVTYFSKPNLRLNDFEGKWLFLDFWSITCRTCIDRFPKMNRLQADFKDRISIVMVGELNPERGDTKALYEKLREHHGLRLISAYDSAIFESWAIRALPRIIIVDPGGTVRVITDGRDLTNEKIETLLAGEAVSFYDSDRDKPIFTPRMRKGLPTNEIIRSSTLTTWQGEEQMFYLNIQGYLDHVDRRSFKTSMVTVEELLSYAYLGKGAVIESDSIFSSYYPVPIVESKHKRLFYDSTQTSGRVLYNYEIILPGPRATAAIIMESMQEDLRESLHLNGIVEERSFPVWSLVTLKDVKKLRSKGGPTTEQEKLKIDALALGLRLQNVTTNQLLRLLRGLDSDYEPVYLDRSNINFNLDIYLEGPLLTVDDVRRSLNKNHLDLVRYPKDLTVLVIKDAE